MEKRHRNDWRLTLALFALTGLVESLAWGHLGAFTPLYLAELRVPPDSVGYWVGILSSLGFVIGLPLLPFWGVWADRYGRKLVIVRSSIAGAIMFALASRAPDVWTLAASRFLGGLVLGNTGVMMAVQTEITPRRRLGLALAIAGAGSPIGMAAGPLIGGWMVAERGVRPLLMMDALLTMGVALLLIALLREEPRGDRPRLGTRAGLVAAFRAIAGLPAVRGVFGATFLMAYGLSVAQPYLPVLVERLHTGAPQTLPIVIGNVLTAAGLAMAATTPLWGWAGDRLGYVAAWRICAVVVGLAHVGQAAAGSVESVAAWRVLQGLCQGGVTSLAMALLAVETPATSRSTVMALSLLPMQLAWFTGPLSGAALQVAGARAPFWAGAAALALGVGATRWLTGRRGERPPAAAAPTRQESEGLEGNGRKESELASHRGGVQKSE